MKRSLAAFLFLVASLPVLAAEPAAISTMSWLAGCWEGGPGGTFIEEQWMAPRGGMMLGMGRTIVDGRTREYEQVSIREQDGRLVYIANPSGQAQASFRSIELTPSRVVFENPEHDFPQRILYSLAADGSLLARIEGKQGGELRGIDYSMRRVACPGP